MRYTYFTLIENVPRNDAATVFTETAKTSSKILYYTRIPPRRSDCCYSYAMLNIIYDKTGTTRKIRKKSQTVPHHYRNIINNYYCVL